MENKVYGYVTERIVKALEEGTIPWRQPWFGTNHAPRNLVSGKPYRGINALLLSCMSYPAPYFLSKKQIKDRGGKIKKGEKGNMVVFFKMWEVPGQTDDNGKPKKIPFLRYYLVWNVTQCDGIEYPKPEPRTETIDPIADCETIWDNWEDAPPVVTGNKAAYNRAADQIEMPDMQLFETAEEYYSTKFHEGIHGTGHEKRIGRDLTGRFASGSYSREELVAEIGAAMLCGIAGIDAKTIENSAAYCAHWAGKLKDDEKLIVKAAGQAQKAADYILGVKFAEKTEDETVTA